MRHRCPCEHASCWTYGTEAAISPNKPYSLIRKDVGSVGGVGFHGFYVLFRKEPVALARLQVLTERFFVKFRHELPGPNAQTETQTPLNTLSSTLC